MGGGCVDVCIGIRGDLRGGIGIDTRGDLVDGETPRIMSGEIAAVRASFPTSLHLIDPLLVLIAP